MSFKKTIKTSVSNIALLTVILTLIMILNSVTFTNNTHSPSAYSLYKVDNPYETVNWETFCQYKANFHAHTNYSESSYDPADMIKDHYIKNYDVLAITDHNHTTWEWNNKEDSSKIYLTDEEYNVITNKVTPIMGNEQSETDHINSFFVDWTNSPGDTMANTIETIENLGGLTQINHPGRYTNDNPTQYEKYVNIFKEYDSCIGMEIINGKDGQPNDRILWDNILTETMPERPVWGFSNDDTHSLASTGFSYNIMLMPENNEEQVRYSMENGTFYATALIASELDKHYNPYVPAPTISNIVVENNSITIAGDNFYKIEWISEGEVIANGSTIDLGLYDLNSYVRANLYGEGGISFTQPFGLTKLSNPSSNNIITKDLNVILNNPSIEALSEMHKYFMYNNAYHNWINIVQFDLNRGIIDTNDYVKLTRLILK